ncbi:MAG: rod shape-determining protein MreD [Clostridia bacterium]|nr:rod shape-determining protein MreD [Clostridia bacterium]
MKPKLRWIITGILFLILGLTEHCVGPFWWGCNPPYLLCCVVVCAMFFEEKTASLFGLIFGLFADSMSSGIFGFRGVLYLCFGYLVAFLSERVLSRNVFSSTLTGILSVALAEIISWGVENLNHTVPFVQAARYVFLPRLVMALPVMLLLYVVFTVLFRERDSYPVRRR